MDHEQKMKLPSPPLISSEIEMTMSRAIARESQQPPTSLRFLDLPPEIRRMIYGFITDDDAKTTLFFQDPTNRLNKTSQWSTGEFGGISRLPTLWRIARTCTTVYNKAIPMLYGALAISMTIPESHPSSDAFVSRFRVPTTFSHIRDLTIHLPVQANTSLVIRRVLGMFKNCREVESVVVLLRFPRQFYNSHVNYFSSGSSYLTWDGNAYIWKRCTKKNRIAQLVDAWKSVTIPCRIAVSGRCDPYVDVIEGRQFRA